MDDPGKDDSSKLNDYINASSFNLDQFEQFLVLHGLKNQLEFIWAVQGLKTESHPAVGNIIRTIYKHYFDEIQVSDTIKEKVRNHIKNREYCSEIFDEAVDGVWQFLVSQVSDEFFAFVEQLEAAPVGLLAGEPLEAAGANQDADATDSVGSAAGSEQTAKQEEAIQHGVHALCISDTSKTDASKIVSQPRKPRINSSSDSPETITTSVGPTFNASVPKSASTIGLVPLVEDQELANDAFNRSTAANSSGTAVVGLTKENMKATQKFRCAVEGSSGAFNKPKFPYRFVSGASYNPVSRQDSEVQSFSSGCLTDNDSVIESRNTRKVRKDDVNCDNLEDAPPPKPHRRCYVKPGPGVAQGNQIQISHSEQLSRHDFYQLLCQKLNAYLHSVQKDQKDYETKKLHDELHEAVNAKLGFEHEDAPDDILSRHVSRVWPGATPDHVTPESRSPPGRMRRTRMPPSLNNHRPLAHISHGDPEQQLPLPRSRTFPSQYEQFDSGISVATASTIQDKKLKRKIIHVIATYKDKDKEKADEPPYSFKITTMTHVTLGLFKQNLPIKGNYRCFFKSNGNEGVVMEEVRAEDAELPLFEANRSSLFEGLDTELNTRVQFENAFVQNRKWEKLEAQIKNMNLVRSSVCYFAKTSEEKRSRYRALQAGLGKEIESINKDMRSMEKDIQVLLDCEKIVETRLENNGEFKVYLERVVKESSKNFKSPTDVVKQAQSYLTIRESLLGNISELHEAISEGKRRLAWIDCWKMLVNTRLSNEMSHAWTRHGELTQGLARIETYFADASEKHKGKSTLLARIEACVANIHRLLVDQLKIVSDPVKSVTLATQLEEMPKLLAELKKMAVVMRSDYIGESDEGFQGPSTVSESH